MRNAHPGQFDANFEQARIRQAARYHHQGADKDTAWRMASNAVREQMGQRPAESLPMTEDQERAFLLEVDRQSRDRVVVTDQDAIPVVDAYQIAEAADDQANMTAQVQGRQGQDPRLQERDPDRQTPAPVRIVVTDGPRGGGAGGGGGGGGRPPRAAAAGGGKRGPIRGILDATDEVLADLDLETLLRRSAVQAGLAALAGGTGALLIDELNDPYD